MPGHGLSQLKMSRLAQSCSRDILPPRALAQVARISADLLKDLAADAVRGSWEVPRRDVIMQGFASSRRHRPCSRWASSPPQLTPGPAAATQLVGRVAATAPARMPAPRMLASLMPAVQTVAPGTARARTGPDRTGPARITEVVPVRRPSVKTAALRRARPPLEVMAMASTR